MNKFESLRLLLDESLNVPDHISHLQELCTENNLMQLSTAYYLLNLLDEGVIDTQFIYDLDSEDFELILSELSDGDLDSFNEALPKLLEDAPVNSNGPGGISPPAAANLVSTNVPTMKKAKGIIARRPKLKSGVVGV